MKPFTVTLLRHGDTPLSGRLIGQRSDPPPTAAAQVQLAATLAQLHDNIASIDLALPPAVLEGIEAIHRRFPNPAP